MDKYPTIAQHTLLKNKYHLHNYIFSVYFWYIFRNPYCKSANVFYLFVCFIHPVLIPEKSYVVGAEISEKYVTHINVVIVLVFTNIQCIVIILYLHIM